MLREAADDYRAISAFESIRVRAEHGPTGLLDRVLPLLRVGTSEERLREEVGAATGEELDQLLTELAGRGLIERTDTEADAPVLAPTGQIASQERFLSNFLPLADRPPESGELSLPNGSEVQKRFAAATPVLLGEGQLTDRVASQLTRAGVVGVRTLNPEPGPSGEDALLVALDGADLLVVCPEHPRVSLLRLVNRVCLERHLTWTSARTLGARVEVGPTVVPGDTACHACYEQRRQSNDPTYLEGAERAERLALADADTGRLAVDVADGILAAEALKLLGGFSRPITYGTLFTLDLLTLESGLHPVLKIPRCSVCGAPARNRPTTSVWPFAP
jgi:bacteriocin biosynthesis cyclodehydratase domain-containing protein